jgi:hypothetical protein
MTIRSTALAPLAALAMSSAVAQAEAPRTPPGGNEDDWRQRCSARADETGMAGTMKDTFVVECVAGERVSAAEAAKAKGKADGKPANKPK